MKTLAGFGYDVHSLTQNRKLILGGVEIPFKYGLKGHSDGDVLTHALIDALLGAGSLGDIGEHFPDDKEQYKDISSISLLIETRELIEEKKLTIYNIDTVIVAEQPKLSNYNNLMRKNIAEALRIEVERINIKAKTTEGLGFTGRLEGIAAYALANLLSEE